jgi:hypothetical protein
VKLPGGATPIGSEIGEIDATREVGGQIDEKDEAR